MRRLERRAQSGTDLIIVVVILFLVAFIGIIISNLWSGIDAGIQGTNIDANSKAASSEVASNFPSGFDIGLVVALGLSYVGLFITSRNIQTNPMFFFINVFFLLLSLGFAAVMANLFDSTNTNALATTRASMPAAVFVMNHFLEFAVLAVVVIIVGLFAKPEGA